VRTAIAAVCWLLLTVSSQAAASNDPYFEQQWNLAQIGAPEAWAHSTGAGVTIGIVDSGIDATHPDLAGKIDAQVTCIGGSCKEGSAKDGDGHGTAVAGIAAAATGNGAGIAGVAPDAHFIVAKALSDEGVGDTDDINNAIRWVVDHGAKVVNLSLGDPSVVLTSRLGSPLSPSIEYAWSRGAIPVLAAGNYVVGFSDGTSANYGNLDAVIVGATDKQDALAWYSTPLGNAKWGIVAPGGGHEGPGKDVISPILGGKYDWLAGTSMATPHVSGALALLLATGLTPTAAVTRLLATADHAVACGDACHGRLRIGAALAPDPAKAAAPPAATSRRPADGGTDFAPLLARGLALVAAGLVVFMVRAKRHKQTG
jgi:subtilisin family serine protease